MAAKGEELGTKNYLPRSSRRILYEGACQSLTVNICCVRQPKDFTIACRNKNQLCVLSLIDPFERISFSKSKMSSFWCKNCWSSAKFNFFSAGIFLFMNVHISWWHKGLDPVGVKVSSTSFFVVKAFGKFECLILWIQMLGQWKFVLRLNFAC